MVRMRIVIAEVLGCTDRMADPNSLFAALAGADRLPEWSGTFRDPRALLLWFYPGDSLATSSRCSVLTPDPAQTDRRCALVRRRRADALPRSGILGAHLAVHQLARRERHRRSRHLRHGRFRFYRFERLRQLLSLMRVFLISCRRTDAVHPYAGSHHRGRPSILHGFAHSCWRCVNELGAGWRTVGEENH